MCFSPMTKPLLGLGPLRQELEPLVATIACNIINGSVCAEAYYTIYIIYRTLSIYFSSSEDSR